MEPRRRSHELPELPDLHGQESAESRMGRRAVWGKGQERVGAAVHEMARALPFPILDLHADNGSEFINHHLFAYCQQQGIRLSRSRPYKKNDNALVEQKNWAAVRRHVGYDRYSTRVAFERFQEVHRLAGLLHNFFLPVMKLLYKSRQGARVRKVYDTAQTPYQRLSALNVLPQEHKDSLQGLYRSLNPSLRNPVEQGPGSPVGHRRPAPRPPPPGNINYGATTYCPVTSSIDAIRDPAPLYTPVMRPSSFTSSALGVPGRPGMVDTAPETG